MEENLKLEYDKNNFFHCDICEVDFVTTILDNEFESSGFDNVHCPLCGHRVEDKGNVPVHGIKRSRKITREEEDDWYENSAVLSEKDAPSTCFLSVECILKDKDNK